MTYQNFLIANFNEGERKDLEPWLIPENAFASLENVFFYRGILQKRYGYSYFGRMGVYVATAGFDTGDGGKVYGGSLAGTPVMPGSFSSSDALSQEAFVDNGDGTLTGSAGGTGTINYSTGAVVLNYNANLAVATAINVVHHYFTTGSDRTIRGIFNLENNVGQDSLIVCDADYLAVWDTTYKYFANQTKTGGSYDIFGNKSGLMWGAQYKQKLWLCDGIDSTTASGIWTYDPSASPPVVLQKPQWSSSSNYTVDYCKMIFPYYRRLVLLSTRETADGGSNYTNYLQRARWSKLDDPTAWRDDIPGEGAELSAATNEAIVSGAIINGVLIVAFERSIWILEYTGDYLSTFRWRKLAGNLEIGTQFGRILTDSYAAFVGRGGIYACDGVTVQKIDAKLPEFTRDDIDLDNMNLCHGIYDDNLDHNLFTYPAAPVTTSNSRTLVLGQNGGWFSEYDYGMHCLGKYVYTQDATFSSLTDGTTPWSTYEGITFKELAHQSKGIRVLGGNTKGYVYHVNDQAENQDNPEETATKFNFSVLTKRFNPFVQQGVKVRLGWIDLLVETQDECSFTADLYQNQDMACYASRDVECSGISYKVWKRINVSNLANFHQLGLRLSATQIADDTQSIMRPKIHAMKLAFEPAGDVRTT